MADKIANLKIFADNNDKMNLSLKEVGGEILYLFPRNLLYMVM